MNLLDLDVEDDMKIAIKHVSATKLCFMTVWCPMTELQSATV